jgi:tetratricopeptide (TPR) repeat protein
MRIALLLDSPASAEQAAAGELAAHPDARVLLFSHADRAAHALGMALHAYGASDDDVIVVRPVGDGVVDAATWQDELARRALPLDDDAAIERRIAEASRALDEGRLDDAQRGYARCDVLLADERGPRRAEVLTCLARIAEARELPDEAARHLEHALAIFPMHRGAVAMRRELARRGGDAEVAAAMTRRLLAFASADDERVGLLTEAADYGLRVAVDAMNAALRIRPRDGLLLDRLRAVHEATADWPRAVDVAVAVAEQIREPRARARAFVAAAETSAARAKNVGRAVALYEAALADDPEVPGAFEAIEKVLLADGDFGGAERAYVRHLARLVGRGQAEAVLLDKLARVREVHLGDRRGAIQALDRLVVLRPDDVEALTWLARLLEDNGEDALAVRCLEVAALHAPARTETFRALARISTRIADADRAYAACGVLVHLGEADLDEQLTYQQFAPEVAVRPAQPLDEAGWHALLPPELDGVVSSLLAAIAPAAITARVDQLRANKTLPKPDPSEKQDVERTTVSAVRTAVWVSKLLGVPTPALYLRKHDVPGGVAVIPTLEPALALGPSVLTGRSVTELSFLFARELGHVRMTGRMLTFYPQLGDLRALVTAAIHLVIGQTGQLPPEVEVARRELAKRLDPTHQAKLAGVVRALTDRGGQLDLLAWLRAVERAACRAGLLACGDVTVAARVLSVDGHVVGGLSAADRLRDLVPFSVSPRYSEVRRALGIAVRTSQLG